MKAFSLAALPMLLLGATAIRPPVHPPAINKGCCCCDISIPAISCDRSIPPDECLCAAVVCPREAPTVWHGVPPPPRPTPTTTVEPAPDALKACCCCNPNINKTVCELRPAQDCFCLAVACPPDSETIYVQPTAAPAS
ncbi:hypothetical protein V8C37DRAFT_317634 [Trichoderma ceciliae]